MANEAVYTILITSSLAAALSLSCNKASFSAQNKKVDPQNHVVPIDGIESQDTAGERRVRSFDNVDFQITTKGTKVENSVETVVFPVDLYFVVDRTASMEGEINEVKRGVVEIATQLKAKGVDLQAGFIGFVDDQTDTAQNPFSPMTSDLENLTRYIETVKTMGNSDYSEGSLAAVSKAVDRFIAGDGRPNAAKMILLVTDVVGHNGGPIGESANVNRDCSIDPLTKKINDYAASLGDPARFKLFYVVPDPQYLDDTATGDLTNATTTCATAPGASTKFNAKLQMEALMNQITPTVAREKRGGPLLDANGRNAWPLKDNNLVTSLIPMIAGSKPQQKTLSCLATKFVAMDGAKELYKWEAPSIAAINQDQSPYITMNDVLRTEQQRGQGIQSLQLRVNRCCVEQEVINGGGSKDSLSIQSRLSCQKEYVQTLNYKIINE